MVDSMLVGPKVMLVGHEGRTWGQSGRRVIHNAESLYYSLGVIPKLIKVGIKGRSLVRVIGPWRLPITRWVGIVQDRRIPFMGSCKVYSWIPLQIFISGSTNDRIPSTTPGAEPPRDAKDSGSARSHSTHLETSSSDRP